MDPQTSFVLASIAAGLASVCVVLSLWSFVRLTRVEANVGSLDAKLPNKRARELEQGFDAMTDAFESHQQKMVAWKQAVHNSVQRMDQIMRRNENASEQLLDTEGNIQKDVVPGELPDIVKVAAEDPVGLSKQAALRFRYNKNRGS